MNRYRLNRAHKLLSVGACVVAIAVAVFVAFIAAGAGAVGRTVSYVAVAVALLALIAAVRLFFWPPTVLELTPVGYKGRSRSAGGTFVGRWKDIEDVAISSASLRITPTGRDAQEFPLNIIEPAERLPMIRAVYDHLNSAHGYKRFEFK